MTDKTPKHGRVEAGIAEALAAEINATIAECTIKYRLLGGSVGRQFVVKRAGGEASWHTTSVYSDMVFVGAKAGKRLYKDGTRKLLFCFTTMISGADGDPVKYEVEAEYDALVKKTGEEFDHIILGLMGKPFSELVEMLEEHAATNRFHRAAGTQINISDIVPEKTPDIVGWGRWNLSVPLS